MLFVAFSITLLGGFADVFCFSGNPTFSAEQKVTAISPFLIKDVTVDGGASIVEKNISADGTKVTFKVSFSAPGKATSTVTFKAPNPWPAGILPQDEIPHDDVIHEFTVIDVEKITYQKIKVYSKTISQPIFKDLPPEGDSYLKLHMGSEVKFKAVLIPVLTPFPSTFPLWSGTSGATGMGEEVTVTFGTASTNDTDFKVVKAGNKEENTLVCTYVLGNVIKLSPYISG